MELLVEQVDVWAATRQDQSGGLAGVLTSLRDAGADLQFIIARRASHGPGKGVVFVTPLQGDRSSSAIGPSQIYTGVTLALARTAALRTQ